jgi:hypothetical protein
MASGPSASVKSPTAAIFAVTYLWVLVLYPPLVQPASTTLEDVAWLERLGLFTWRYLLLAASLPMLVMTLALWVGSPHQRALLAALCLGSLVGLGLAFWLCRGLQRGLKILKQAVARSHQVPPRARRLLWEGPGAGVLAAFLLPWLSRGVLFDKSQGGSARAASHWPQWRDLWGAGWTDLFGD